MDPITVATHSRYNKKKKKTNYFQKDNNSWFILNGTRYEPYHGGVDGLVDLKNTVQDLTNDSTKHVAKTKLKKKSEKVKKSETTTDVYDSVVPTFSEEVMDYIPSPVLRSLLQHYKDADVVEVEINVKTTHTIKG